MVDTSDWFDFSGQVALVCGGAGGIGREVSLGLARHGAQVVVADIDLEAATRVAEEHDDIDFASLDVRDRESVDAAVAHAWELKGVLDIVVNAAAVYVRVPAIHLEETDYDRVMDINVKGTWLLCQAAGRRMIERGRGRIINYTSNAGLRGSPLQVVYNASKAAVISMTKTLAVEWARTGVTVNAVAPGPTDTSLMTPAFQDPATIQAFEQRIPSGQLSPSDATVGPVLFLASKHAGLITGHVLFADGGMSAT